MAEVTATEAQIKEKVIRVGSRKSELALIQTKYVIGRLQKLNPGRKFEIHTMSTMGDRVLNISLPKIGEKSLFTRDLEEALRTGSVDFVVHSLKDLPTSLPAGMAIGAVLEREDPRDALVLNKKYAGKTLKTLPEGSIIGTSSLRRTAQLSRCYPHLKVCDIRGNLNTRLAKLDDEDSKFAGIILAHAGLLRMGWHDRVSQILDPTDLLYAVGQGALAVESRSNDPETLDMLKELCCLQTQCRILAERSFLKTLGGGCSAPVAVETTLKRKADSSPWDIEITGAVWSLDGVSEVQTNLKCELNLDPVTDDDESEDDANTDGSPPTKRRKMIDGNESGDASSSSPPIINDDSFDVPDCDKSSPNSKSIRLENLMNVHEEMFKKCPFIKEHQTSRENGGGSQDQVDRCPLHLPVGQDFMGQCPFFHKNGDQIVKKLADQIMSKGKEKCPFLHEVQMIEHPDDHNNTTKELPSEENQKYCGLFRHKNVREETFRKCEQLGKSLAEGLIADGALEIMKCAQNEIRQKV